MKYGDTLRQRSIPEWGHFNIDYHLLKDLIKHQTTSGTSKATSIPGQGATSERAFGDTFFRTLKAQHDRINRFVQSKSGEIERRLEHIGKALGQLQARPLREGSSGRLPVRVVERYAKIAADVEKAGEEIRSLSRFQVTQQMGFRKILKKYRRWTGDKELESRFRNDVTDMKDSFYQLDLGNLLEIYVDVLNFLRAIFDASSTSSPPPVARVSSPATQISQAVNDGSEVDFDVAISTTPLGSRGSKATYWIHSDHIVEVEVLLLQHMRLRPGRNTTTPHGSRTSTPHRRLSSPMTDKGSGNTDATGLLVLDCPESFAIKQNASTIGSREETAGTLPAKAAGNARWTSCGNAVVVVGLDQAKENILLAKLKRKYITAFLDPELAFDSQQDSGEYRQNNIGDANLNSSITSTRQWLAKHKNVGPIAGIYSKRSRFVSLHDTSAGGMWATLDNDICMKESLHKDLDGEDWPEKARSGSKRFPHAVLEVRREGNHSATLIQTLDQSHLVERVRGFSLEAHAVWTCCRPSATSAPVWMSLLDNDIRKLPPPLKRQRRKASSAAGSYSPVSPPQTSTSTTSLTGTEGQNSLFTSRNEESSATSAPEFVEPPPLQAFRKKRKPYAEYPPPIQVEPESQRYWNEYDNPESEDDGYYIYLDPNESDKYPGQAFFEACRSTAKKLLRIRETPRHTSLTDESSDDESVDESPVAPWHGYGTFASADNSQPPEGYFSGLFRTFRDPYRDAEELRTSRRERRTLLSELELRQQSNEKTKFRFYSTCIAMATVLNAMLGTMTMTSRRKERNVVGYAVLFGAICGLLLCASALLSMKTRRKGLGWSHQGIVCIVVALNVVVDVLLLVWVFNQL